MNPINKSIFFKKKISEGKHLLKVIEGYDCINTINQFIKPFLDNKMSIFEEYGAFKG